MTEVSGLVVEAVGAPESGGAAWVYRVGLPKFPVKGGAALELVRLVEVLTGALVAGGVGSATLWLDTEELHRDGGSRLLSANARLWSPEMGFCFDPAARPPRKLEFADLMDAEFGTPPRIDDRTAMMVSNTAETLAAYRTVAGRGVAILLYFSGATGAAQTAAAATVYQRHTREQLRRYMAPGEFQDFDFYLPLLSAAGVLGAAEEVLRAWMGEATLYVRECVATDELLLVSRTDLADRFASAGLRGETGGARVTAWRLPLGEERR